MPETQNLGADLLRIHAIITRGLRISIDFSLQFEKEGYPSAIFREGFLSYARTLITVLDGHHHVEDELVFPFLRAKMPDGPYELLRTQHQTMLPAIDQVSSILDELVAEALDSRLLQKLHYGLRNLDEFWRPHIRIEEDFLTIDRAAILISPEEQAQLNALIMEHNQKHTGPDFLVLPFLLFNLPPDQRSVFSRLMPPAVSQQLVPVVWKKKWEPMKPFLLS